MRITIISLSLFINLFVFGQENLNEKIEKNTQISAETQFQLFNNASPENNLKIRFHLSEKHVLRTNWSFSFGSETTEILEIDGDGVGSIENVSSSHLISIGYERHLALDKLSPYLGASFGYGFGKDNEYGSRTDGSVFINDFNYSEEQQFSSLNIDLFSGFDFNIYKGLYVGTEIGFRFSTRKDKRGEIATEDASSTTDSSTTKPIPEKKINVLILSKHGGCKNRLEVLTKKIATFFDKAPFQVSGKGKSQKIILFLTSFG